MSEQLTDLGPACATLADLVRTTPDEALTGPTPCPAYTVADLLDHVGGLAQAFTWSATRQPYPEDGGTAAGDGSRLEPGWRDRIAADLDALAAAWRDPSAYDGMTRAGPVELPAAVAAAVALNEVVVHGWDLAVATGRTYDPDPAAVADCLEFASSFEAPADGPGGDAGPFGPAVPVPTDAALLHRLAGATGRDPHWTA